MFERRHRAWQQVDRHDGRFADVGLEQILFAKLHAIGNARLRGAIAGKFDEVRFDIDAEPATCFEPGCRGDDDAPVTRAEIDDEIIGTDVGQLQHRIDHHGQRRRVRRDCFRLGAELRVGAVGER